MSSTTETQKPFDADQQLLRERLQFFLDTLHPLVKADVVYSLMLPGKLLSIQNEHVNISTLPSGMWSLLPLLVARHIAPYTKRDYIYSVAVAIECFICALDLLDDIEDGDQTLIVTNIGAARVLNVSTTLLALTNYILIAVVDEGCPSEHVVYFLKAVQEALILATAGQHRDILAEQRSASSFTTEECIEIAEGKAGSLMSLACRIGALCVHSNNETLAQFSELGKLLGIAHQLDNDSHDLYYILQRQQTSEAMGSIKTDLVRQKKTLPVILATRAMSVLQNPSLASDEEKQKLYIDVLHESIITTWGISLLYRERAHDQLRRIEIQHPVSHALRLLLGFV